VVQCRTVAGTPPRFTPALFDFLRDLRAHNDREWLQRNKGRYEQDVKAPALLFIEAVGPALHRISKHVVADPRPVGGSMFRINRDIRFSSDKSPYKTALGMSFGHDRGREGPCARLLPAHRAQRVLRGRRCAHA